jgi:small subunit ribosomal protein S1
MVGEARSYFGMLPKPDCSNPQEAAPLGCAVEVSETHMVDFNLIEEIGLEESLANEMIREALGAKAAEGDMEDVLGTAIQKFKSGEILQGTIVGINKDYVVIDVGLKSEGQVAKTEFDDGDDVNVGDTVEVLLESLEDEDGSVALSKRKADRIRGWEKILHSRRSTSVVPATSVSSSAARSVRWC